MSGRVSAAAFDLTRSGPAVESYEAIFTGFAAKGIPESDIYPSWNVRTYDSWFALGRNVKKGERGVRIFSTVELKSVTRDPSDGSEKIATYRQPRSSVVFHISQTENCTTGFYAYRKPRRRCHAGVAS